MEFTLWPLGFMEFLQNNYNHSEISYKIPTVFDCIFRFSIHFILLTAWWCFVKTPWNPGVAD